MYRGVALARWYRIVPNDYYSWRRPNQQDSLGLCWKMREYYFNHACQNPWCPPRQPPPPPHPCGPDLPLSDDLWKLNQQAGVYKWWGFSPRIRASSFVFADPFKKPVRMSTRRCSLTTEGTGHQLKWTGPRWLWPSCSPPPRVSLFQARLFPWRTARRSAPGRERCLNLSERNSSH